MREMSEAMEVTLARIEERTRNIENQLLQQYATKGDVAALMGRVTLLERILFSMIGIILLAFLGAIGSLVLRAPQP